MTWQVVECSICSGYWIVENSPAHETTVCRPGGTTSQISALKVYFGQNDFEVAAEVRSRILAEHADCRDQYEVENDYDKLGTRVDGGREEYILRQYLDRDTIPLFNKYVKQI